MKLLTALTGLLLATFLGTAATPVVASDSQPSDADGRSELYTQSYAKCIACHELAKDKPHGLGPNLAGVFGREMGAVEGFRFSRAMRTGGLIWDEQSLDAFLKNPQQTVPGTTMPFAGIKNDRDRADIVSLLKAARAQSPSQPNGVQ